MWNKIKQKMEPNAAQGLWKLLLIVINSPYLYQDVASLALGLHK